MAYNKETTSAGPVEPVETAATTAFAAAARRELGFGRKTAAGFVAACTLAVEAFVVVVVERRLG